MSEQSVLALRKAKQYHIARAETKRWIKTASTMRESRERLCEVLMDPPSHTHTMLAVELVAVARRMGAATSERLLGRHHIGLSKTVGGLTVRQAAELAADLRGETWFSAFGEAA